MREKARRHLELCDRIDGRGVAANLIQEMLDEDSTSHYMAIAITLHWAAQKIPDEYTEVWGYGQYEVYATLLDTAELLEQALNDWDPDEFPYIACYTLLDDFKVNMEDPIESYYALGESAGEFVREWIAKGGNDVSSEERAHAPTAENTQEEGPVEEKACFKTTQGETLPTEGTTADAPECDIVCPHCGANDPHPEDTDIETNRVYVEYTCDDCESTWKCAFDLTGYSDFEVGKVRYD
jgi:hypothetical protein